MARALPASIALFVLVTLIVVAGSLVAASSAADPNASIIGGTVTVAPGDTASNLATSGVLRRNASLNASFADDTVVADTPATNATLRVVTPDDDAVLLTSEQFTTEQLGDIVDGNVTEDGVRVTLPDDGEIPVSIPHAMVCDVTDSLGGNYSFTVSGVESRETDSATLQVGSQASLYATIVEDGVPVESGGTAAIHVEVDELACSDEVTVVLAHENGAAFARATVVDADGDDLVEVRIDTANVTRAPETAFDAVGNDRVRSASVDGDAPTGPLPDDQYHLSVGNGDETPTDVAVLLVGDRETATATTTTITTRTSPQSATTATTTTTTETPDTTARPVTTSATGPGFTVGAALAVLSLFGMVGRRR